MNFRDIPVRLDATLCDPGEVWIEQPNGDVQRVCGPVKEVLVMNDPTEALRKHDQAVLNSDQSSREELAAKYGPGVYDTDELCEHFEVLQFLAPYVEVRRKSDGVHGTLMFRHHPRLYFGFEASGQ
jgi:hypothetical protein